jgi:hypothetical protein
MPVEFQNFEFSYKNSKGKPVFAPTESLRTIGNKLIGEVSHRAKFPEYYFHFAKGGHVAALHSHRNNEYFARIDISNFFYSVGRNKLKKVLKSIGVGSPEHYARWSTVKNPYLKPKYSLPYGFPQSPILASLVLQASTLGAAIGALPQHITRSVYLDDIAISGANLLELNAAFADLIAAASISEFDLNQTKTEAPDARITIFNCDLTNGYSVVRDERIEEFNEQQVSELGRIAFEKYVESVSRGNT